MTARLPIPAKARQPHANPKNRGPIVTVTTDSIAALLDRAMDADPTSKRMAEKIHDNILRLAERVEAYEAQATVRTTQEQIRQLTAQLQQAKERAGVQRIRQPLTAEQREVLRQNAAKGRASLAEKRAKAKAAKENGTGAPSPAELRAVLDQIRASR
jgi:hypothetical protein